MKENFAVLTGSSFLGAVGRDLAPHPCPPAARKMWMTFGDRHVPDGGRRAGKPRSSCRGQISAAGLESRVPLCAGTREDALISLGDK